MSNNPILQDDEIADISFYELQKWFIENIKTIFCITATFFAGSIIYSLLATHIYTAEIILVPRSNEANQSSMLGSVGGLASLAGIEIGDSYVSKKDEFLSILTSQIFMTQYLNENKIKSEIYPDDSNWKAVEKWRQYNFSYQVSIKTGVIKGSLSYTDPEKAAIWLNLLFKDINNYIRVRDIKNSEQKIENLKNELSKSNTNQIKSILYKLTEEQMRDINIANSTDEYAFKIIDPAITPEERSSPRRTRIVIFWSIIGFILSIPLTKMIQLYNERKH